MKKKILGIAALLVVSTMALTSCGLVNSVVDFVTGIFSPAVELTDAGLNAEKIIDFADGANPDVLFESDGWTNGDVFNVVWKKNNVKYENGIMILGITEEKASAWLNDAEVEFNYTAGEARTQNYYHYGDYEVSMKPSKNPGTASTFFTCTGPYDTKFVLDENGDYVLDENGQRLSVSNPHDEIDIEFLGNDTTHVQFNFFVDGVGGNEYMHDLGFDASEEFHTYGYRWEPDSITWFVDGVPVYKVTTDTSVEEAKNLRIVEKLPSTPGRILTNYWCGNERAAGWMGVYLGNINDQGTEYQWIATSAQGEPLNPPEKPNEEIVGIDWSSVEAIVPTFESTELYTVAVDGTSANISYTEVGGSCYKNVEMDITEAAKGKNYIHLVVTNNGDNAVRFRVNVVDQALVDAGAQNMSTNDSATVNGESAWTDHEWGGSFFDLAAGETYEIVIVFKGEVEKLQLMPDSSKNDSSVNAGNITVSEIKFTTVGEVEIPHSCVDADGDITCDECGKGMIVPPSVENPTSGNLTLDYGVFTTTIGGNVTDGYGVNVDENNSIHVEYTNIVGNSYKNIWANVSAVATTKNTITAKITNNGDAAVKVRFDIESESQTSPNTTCCNVSATQDGVGVFTDTEWGGSVFVIEAGATANIELVYDASKKPTNLKIMIDSCQWDDSTSHAGNIVISDINFVGEYTPEGGGDPVTPPVDDGLRFDFWASNDEVYTTNGNNIKYNGVGNSYTCVGTDIADLAAGKNTFTVTITNNGAADSRVRVDIQGTEIVGNHSVINTSATGGDVWTDMEWGGSVVTVVAGQSVTLVITYDNYTDRGAAANLILFVDSGRGDEGIYSSDITLSGMAFSGEATPPAGGEESKPEDVAVNFSDVTISTTTDEELAKGISASAGLAIDGNKKEIDGFSFTQRLKLGGTMKVESGVVKAGVKIDTEGAATIVLYAISSSSSDSTRTLQLATLTDGALVKIAETAGVDGAAIAKYEFKVEEAGTYYIGSTKSGINIYYIAVVYAEIGGEVEPPVEQPVEGEYLSFTANDCYTLSATSEEYVNAIQVTYSDVSTNSYQNVNTYIADKAADKNTLGVTIKNNGDATVYITVKLEAAGAVALAEEKVELAVGETCTVSVAFDGVAEMLFFFVDSGWSQETTSHAGDITISGINFK